MVERVAHPLSLALAALLSVAALSPGLLPAAAQGVLPAEAPLEPPGAPEIALALLGNPLVLLPPGGETRVDLQVWNNYTTPSRVEVTAAASGPETWVLAPAAVLLSIPAGDSAVLSFALRAPSLLPSVANLTFQANGTAEPPEGTEGLGGDPSLPQGSATLRGEARTASLNAAWELSARAVAPGRGAPATLHIENPGDETVTTEVFVILEPAVGPGPSPWRSSRPASPIPVTLAPGERLAIPFNFTAPSAAEAEPLNLTAVAGRGGPHDALAKATERLTVLLPQLQGPLPGNRTADANATAPVGDGGGQGDSEPAQTPSPSPTPAPEEAPASPQPGPLQPVSARGVRAASPAPLEAGEAAAFGAEPGLESAAGGAEAPPHAPTPGSTAPSDPAVLATSAPQVPPPMPDWLLLVLAAAAGTVLAGALLLRATRSERVQFVLLAPLVGLYTRLRRHQVLDHDAREGLYTRIQEQPGASLSDLRRASGLALGALVHHLRTLEEHRFIVSERDGPLRRFYPVGVPRPAVGERLGPTQERILGLLREAGPLAQADLAARLDLTRQAVNKHVKALERRGRLTLEEKEGRRVYTPVDGGGTGGASRGD